jgi:hypothetical protein
VVVTVFPVTALAGRTTEMEWREEEGVSEVGLAFTANTRATWRR